MDVAVQKTPLAKWYTHLVYYALRVCFVNGGRCIEYTASKMVHTFGNMHMEYALLMGGCIEDTAIE